MNSLFYRTGTVKNKDSVDSASFLKISLDSELGSTTLQLESSLILTLLKLATILNLTDFPLRLLPLRNISDQFRYLLRRCIYCDNLSQFNSNNETYIDIETNTSDNTRVVNGENLYCYNSLTRSYIEEGVTFRNNSNALMILTNKPISSKEDLTKENIAYIVSSITHFCSSIS